MFSSPNGTPDGRGIYAAQSPSENVAEDGYPDIYGKVEVYECEDEGESRTRTAVSGSGIGNRHLFQGREWDAEVGLYQFRQRAYAPTAGRFTVHDPLGTRGDRLLSLFRYAQNSPGNYVDPFGCEAEFGLVLAEMSTADGKAISAGEVAGQMQQGLNESGVETGPPVDISKPEDKKAVEEALKELGKKMKGKGKAFLIIIIWSHGQTRGSATRALLYDDLVEMVSDCVPDSAGVEFVNGACFGGQLHTRAVQVVKARRNVDPESKCPSMTVASAVDIDHLNVITKGKPHFLTAWLDAFRRSRKEGKSIDDSLKDAFEAGKKAVPPGESGEDRGAARRPVEVK